MNARFSRAKTPEERIAIAVVEANKEFYRRHRKGKKPNLRFYIDFLEPFIEREVRQAGLDELHLQIHGPTRIRERELVDSLQHWIRLCEEKISRQSTKKGKVP